MMLVGRGTLRKRIRWMIRVAVAAQIMDGATFLLVAGQYGVSGETNPLIRFLWNLGGGFLVVVFVKLLLIWWLLVITKIGLMRGARVLPLTLLVFTASIGAVGAVSNVWSFVILSGGK